MEPQNGFELSCGVRSGRFGRRLRVSGDLPEIGEHSTTTTLGFIRKPAESKETAQEAAVGCGSLQAVGYNHYLWVSVNISH
jgi:hypothetical protein